MASSAASASGSEAERPPTGDESAGDAARQPARRGTKKKTNVRMRSKRTTEDEETQDSVVQTEEFRVLILGGKDGQDLPYTTEVIGCWGTKNRKMVPGPLLRTPRWGCAVAWLDEERFLVAGGSDGFDDLDSTEIIDVKAGTTEDGPRMMAPRNGCSLVHLNERQLLVIGGYHLDSTEVLDIATMTFSNGPRLFYGARACCCAVMLDEHRVFLAGGYDRTSCSNTTEIMDVRLGPKDEEELGGTGEPILERQRFKPGPQLVQRRGGCAGACVDADHVVVVGGFDGAERLNTSEVVDLQAMVSAEGPQMSTKRAGCTAAYYSEPRPHQLKEELPLRYVIVAGGLDDNLHISQNSVETLDMDDMKFHPDVSMPMRDRRAYGNATHYSVPVNQQPLSKAGSRSASKMSKQKSKTMDRQRSKASMSRSGTKTLHVPDPDAN